MPPIRLAAAFALATLLTSSTALAARAQDGLTLYQAFDQPTTLLVDGSGATVHSWPGTLAPGLSVYLLPDGDMLRTQRTTSGPPGTGGGIQRLSYSGALEWEFSFFDATYTPHHDVEVLPNGNVLMIVWEEVGSAEAIAQGRNPATAGTTCVATGVFNAVTNAQDLLETVGPCAAGHGQSIF